MLFVLYVYVKSLANFDELWYRDSWDLGKGQRLGFVTKVYIKEGE